MTVDEKALEAAALAMDPELYPLTPTIQRAKARAAILAYEAAKPAAAVEIEAVREALGAPEGWREQREALQSWTTSAFLAGEKVANEAWHKRELYGDLNRLVQWLHSAEDAARAALASTAPAAEKAETERDRLAKLVEGWLAEPVFQKSPHARMALTVAARDVRRGRKLTTSERFDNLTSAIEEDDPALANRLRDLVTHPDALAKERSCVECGGSGKIEVAVDGVVTCPSCGYRARATGREAK